MVFVPVWDKNGAAHDTAMCQDAKKIDLDRFLFPLQARFFSNGRMRNPPAFISAQKKSWHNRGKSTRYWRHQAHYAG
ncbi:hypothetical protein [Pantoea septica]|uniref:hypothetical protein n=1 Tax=Pantoea septica TaxID=472695 RepID=UPI00289D638B|nr:hypothetical protein [Pantoea septica]